MRRTLIMLVVGLTPRLVGANTPRLAALARDGAMRPLRTVLPAVTCSVQSSLVTGLEPRDGSFGDGAPPRGAREFPNSARSRGWVPPCPPSGTHRYLFAVYALDAGVRAASSEDALAQIRRHVIAWGALTTLVSA